MGGRGLLHVFSAAHFESEVKEIIEVKLYGPLLVGARVAVRCSLDLLRETRVINLRLFGVERCPLVGGWFCIVAMGNTVGARTLVRYKEVSAIGNVRY